MWAGEVVWADVACWDPEVLGASTVIGPRRVLRPARTTTPRLGGGVGTSFLGPKLAVAWGVDTGGAASVSRFRECRTAKYPCSRTIRPPTLCIAAMRPLVAQPACLDGSSPNLAVPQGAAIFCLAHRLQERRPCGPRVLTKGSDEAIVRGRAKTESQHPATDHLHRCRRSAAHWHP